MKAVLVLPTYNERENIKILIPQILEQFKDIRSYSMSLLVVDDNSPDGTAEEVKKFKKKHKNIHLISGKKQGLGVAYLRGFDYAAEKLKADILMMMDADLSHPPELIPKFIEEINSGYDFVIGSRYIKGGGTPDWGFRRKLISWGGNFFARIIAGMYSVNDCTSGFRAFKVNIYRSIDRDALHTRGYAFISTFLYEFITAGAKVKQIPLVFHDRKYGQTKLQKRDIIEFFLNSFRLRFKSSKRMIKFGIVGGTGIFINIGVFSTLKALLYYTFGKSDAALLASSLTGDEISILWNFFLNHIWTFRKSTNKDPILKKIAKFHLVALWSIIINNIILYVLYTHFGVMDVLAKFTGIAAAFVWNYFVNVKWTWRERI